MNNNTGTVYLEDPADYISLVEFSALPRHERLGERGVPASREVTTQAYMYRGRHQWNVRRRRVVTK